MVEADAVTITIWATIVIGGYHSLEYLFPRVTERFRSLSLGRRRYVIKNLLKSGLLLVLGIMVTPAMFRLFYHSEPDNEFIHTVGVLYAIPDVYALWWVRGMLYQSTIYHHVSVGLLATVGLFVDHGVESHWLAMLVYAYLSMWTGVVNFYLGLRFLLKRDDDKEDRIRRALAEVSLWVYLVCCAGNWLYQLHTVMLWLDFRWAQLTWVNFLGVVAYCAMLAFIVKDDLILMKKLAKECAPYRPPVSLAKQAEHFQHTLKGQIQDAIGRWPLVIRNSSGGINVSTNYPWPIELGTIFAKIQRFQTPYAVSVQAGQDNLTFNISALKSKE